MAVYHWLIVALWLLFILVWGLMALGAKRNVGHSEWWRGSGLRAGVIIAMVLLLRIPTVREALRLGRGHLMATDPLLGAIGAAVCACGIGLCIWARIYIGRNWGMPMSRKQD